MPEQVYSQPELEAALERLTDAERFKEAETMVTRAAPQLQRVLAQAFEAGGWFTDSHLDQARRASQTEDLDQREAAVRGLLAEEARMGMMVGVAVGWTLANELAQPEREDATP
ncbi:MAG: hypothetical protein ACR2NA_12840 [Solirubrobacterales bacterium]